jgi:hypothetical protein
LEFPPRVPKKLTFPEPLYLDIACGDRPFRDDREWIHTDIRVLPDVEIVCDVRELPSRIETKATEILARHILEHFSWRDTEDILREWGSLLIPDVGTVHIQVPNLYAQAVLLATGEMSDNEVIVYIMGDQDYEGNFHKTAFTERTLYASLWNAGFRAITVCDVGLVLDASARWAPSLVDQDPT